MKAATYTAYGPPKTIVMADIATPTPKDGEVLVRVKYAGINQYQLWVYLKVMVGPLRSGGQM